MSASDGAYRSRGPLRAPLRALRRVASSSVRLGVVILPELHRTEAAHAWRHAEDLGFDHGWTYDHLAWSTLRDSTWFGAITTLAAAATVTRRMRIGPLVASPNFRHPVPFAREILALDDLSDGRLTVGLGAGGRGWDATMLGDEPWSARERAERFAEFVELTDQLLRSASTTYEGRHYRARDARMHPGCVQKPRVPFAIAATGPRGMRLAAAFGAAWVTTGDLAGDGSLLDTTAGARVVGRQIARLDEVCAAQRRDPSSIARLVLTGPRLHAGLGSRQELDDTIGAYAAVGVTDLIVHWPRATGPYAGDLRTFERVIAA